MKIALASPPIPNSLASALKYLEELVIIASGNNADIICFPESMLPGYPGMGYTEDDRKDDALAVALDKVRAIAKASRIAVIAPMDWHSPEGLQNVAFVVSSEGEILGYQTKNQLDPSEDKLWIAGKTRTLFHLNGVSFGICICHEGFRYPETVRWAARNGAHIVFHPHFCGSNVAGKKLETWGQKDNPYYEKAMMMRALENTIYFASVNYASTYSESGSAIISPDGTCLTYQDYDKVGVIYADIDPAKATGLLAMRLKNHSSST